MVQSPENGMDEFGIWRDDRSSFAIRAYLDGLLPTMFGAHNWGLMSVPGCQWLGLAV